MTMFMQTLDLRCQRREAAPGGAAAVTAVRVMPRAPTPLGDMIG